ncbi:hypothetical protein [Bradyrhizobium sp. CCBAU 51753]|uniref:hypothetical protein n=1 Tax=Bradyrhizobium sp. CCBAU 51753 TaxID=1325100 RepID=UPI00188C2E7E|nr:hypothetical protein [Bradyrhizobium sp. CCBAU 51753]QOZ29545.1 hypothetical protein XH93_06335 [Bradyrhizobium sp. CCBAU 51753]
MAADQTRLRNNILIAAVMVAAGVAIAAVSLREIASSPPQEVAQATQPLQQSPEPQKTPPPAESKPGGDRPTTPAPEPARPDADAQKGGAKPVLPPAPAEKTAPPIKEK